MHIQKGKSRQNRYEAQPSEFSINETTENQHIPDLVHAFSQENSGFWWQIGRCHSSNPKTLPSIKTIGTCKFSNSKTWPNVKLENNYHIPDLVQAIPKKMVFKPLVWQSLIVPSYWHMGGGGGGGCMGIKRDKSGKSSSQNSAQNLKLKTILYDLRKGKFMKNTNEKRNKIRR